MACRQREEIRGERGEEGGEGMRQRGFHIDVSREGLRREGRGGGEEGTVACVYTPNSDVIICM
jgi:hypothetical protein